MKGHGSLEIGDFEFCRGRAVGLLLLLLLLLVPDISGLPGTGKTATVQSVLKCLQRDVQAKASCPLSLPAYMQLLAAEAPRLPAA